MSKCRSNDEFLLILILFILLVIIGASSKRC
ncbi:YjcZ family sporulation protein [Brevibacillus sp. SYSU BS000544]